MAPPPDLIVYPSSMLRVTADVLPELHRAVKATLEELGPHLQLMQKEAFIEKAWLADPVSEESWRVYNEHVMAKHDGPFHALLIYEQQLRAISERLAEIQRNYDQAETANTDLVRRMT